MSFSAKKFVFDGIPSEVYNVLISSDDGGDTSISSSNTVDIYQESIYRKSVPYFYGATQQSVLSFPVNVFSPNSGGIDAPVSSKIAAWLFGKQQYRKLQILQEDMEEVYFNCFLMNPQTRRVGNKIAGYSFEVVCDNPFAWEFQKTQTYTYVGGELVSDDVLFTNSSDNNDYQYPSLTITMNTSGGDVGITNSSDGGREFEITGLTAGEVLTIDNENGILTSSSGLLRLGSFNKNWLRLVRGRNSLNIHGDIASVVMTYQNQRRIT